MRNNRGITLIELLVAASIVVILAIALGFEFQGWMGGYRVESEVKQMYGDLMYARARAMERNRIHFFIFPTTTSYSIYEDDSDGTNKVPDGDGILEQGTGNGADTQLASFPKTVQYAVTWSGGNISFDSRGLVSPNGTICISTTTNPDYDCIIISQTRINMGKLTTSIPEGGVCSATPPTQNCIAK